MNFRLTNNPSKLFIIIFFIILFFLSFLSFPRDDGLRHVGVAFNGDITWKDVYPFSYFSEFSLYSPWYGYDLILQKSLGLLRYIPIQSLTLKFLFIKVLSFIIVFSVFLLLISKSKILLEVESFQSFLLASICVLMFLTLFFLRSMFIRPFIFGTIFLLLSLGASGYWRGFIYSLFLIFLYPYLAWFYILPVAFCHFFLGDKKFTIGISTTLFAFFLLQDPTFWKLQLGLFTAAGIREQIGKNISELSSSYSSFYCMFILTCVLLSYPTVHTKFQKMNYGDLLLIVYLLPSIMYIRTFVDILLPLVFAVYSKSFMSNLKPMLHNILEPFDPLLFEVKNKLFGMIPRRIIIRIENRDRNHPSKSSLKLLILVLYGILIVFAIKLNMDQLKEVNETETYLSIIPKNSTILSSFNQQYQILFVRPDLKIIPSCDISLPSAEIRNEYIDFLKLGSFRNLASKTSASYLIEAKDIYLNPIESRNLELIGSHDKLNIWKINDPSR